MNPFAELARRRALRRSDLPPAVRRHLAAPLPDGRLQWRQATYTVLDLETTGLDATRDAIVSAGGLRIVRGRALASTAFHLLARPEQHVPAETIRIHGLMPERLAAAPPLREQMEVLLDRLTGDVLVVHVAAVDRAFLNAALRRLWGSPLRAVVLDTGRLAAHLDHLQRLIQPPSAPRPSPYHLADLARAVGLPVHPQHDALNDALTTAQLFLVLATRLEALGLRTLGALRRIVG